MGSVSNRRRLERRAFTVKTSAAALPAAWVRLPSRYGVTESSYLFRQKESWYSVNFSSSAGICNSTMQGRSGNCHCSFACIRDSDAVVATVDGLFSSVREDQLDDPQIIVDEIFALAMARNQKFRTLVGKAAHDLMAFRVLRGSVRPTNPQPTEV